MKLDFYFVTAFIVIYGLIDVHYEIPEFPLTIAIIPLLIIQLGMTIYFTKRENKFWATAAIVCCIPQPIIKRGSWLTSMHRCFDLARWHI